MAREADTASKKQRSSGWLTKVLAEGNVTDQDWQTLSAPRAKSTAEEKDLERVVMIGGREVTVLQVKKQQLLDLVDSAALKLLLALDDPKRIEKATVQQLSVAFGVLIDKARLLRGEPTAIYRHEDVRKLDELGVALMKEMERRGITVEGEVEEEG